MQELISIIDADGVILETGRIKLDYMGQNFPDQDLIKDIKPYQCSRTALVPIVGLEFYEQMNEFIKSRNPTLNTPPLEGALEGLQELSQLFQNNILSHRTPEEIQFVREWMEKYGALPYVVDVSSDEDPKYNSVAEVSGSKKMGIAVYLGATLFVDDDERHMPQEPIDGLHCLLFGESERKNVAPHIIIASNWYGVVAYAQTLVPLQQT